MLCQYEIELGLPMFDILTPGVVDADKNQDDELYWEEYDSSEDDGAEEDEESEDGSSDGED